MRKYTIQMQTWGEEILAGAEKALAEGFESFRF